MTLSYNFRIYDVTGEQVEGNATVRYYINNALISYGTIAQGLNSKTFSSEIGGQLSNGTNTIVVRVEDADGNHRSLTYTVSVIDLTIASTFDNSTPFLEAELTGGAIQFNYVPYGGTTIEKTVYFEIDGSQYGDPVVTKNSGKTMSTTFSGLSHGSHVLRVWMTATVNGIQITSNVLRYDFAYIKANGSDIVLSSDFNEDTIVFGNIISIPFLAYSPTALTCFVNYDIQYERVNQDTGTVQWVTYATGSRFEVDRTMQTINIRDYPTGAVRIRLFASSANNSSSSGTPVRTFLLTISESDLDLDISTEGLALDLETDGRSNAETEATRTAWRDKVNTSVAVQFNDFNWISNGWMSDTDGNTPLKISGGASIEIPYYPFALNAISSSGITIELDFMTDEVSDPNAVLMSCMSEGGPGFEISAEKIRFATDLQEMATQFEPGTRMKVTLVVDTPTSADKLIHMYVNGIDGSGNGVKTFAGKSDGMLQNPALPITANGTGAALYIYSIRVYAIGHSRRDVVANMVASYDTIAQKAQAHYANEIFNEGSDVVGMNEVQESNPDLMILYITGSALPTAKINADQSVTKTSQTVSGQIIDPDPDRCISFENQKIEVQGTSSAAYYRKNLKLTIKKCTNSQGQELSGYKLRSDSILAQKFTFKADVASSENANNVLLARKYNDTCPFQFPPQEIDENVRQGIDGKPCVIFFVCTDPSSPDYNNGQATFIGKYNANIDKGSDPVFGFDQEDENGTPLWPNAQSWEFRNNTSDRCLFRSADFTSKNSDGSFAWESDLEARYAADEQDTSLLQVLNDWVVSTNTENATGRVLSAPYVVTKMMPNAVVYATYIDEEDDNKVKNVTVEDEDGFTRKVVESSRFHTDTITVDGEDYTVMPIDENGNEYYYHLFDTATYRQDKFYQEFENHFYLTDTLFYYLFTEFYLMVDNRAKNMFLTTYDGVHWGFLPYDFDTAIGINNEGELAFGYGLEAIDTVGSSYVFNDQRKSVLWNNFMDTFGAEIKAMYNAQETAGNYNPAATIKFFRDHQAAWPMAMWNEDADFKYGEPHRNGDDTYLPMWQGSKQAQREWWLNHRFLYMCSKYLSASALADRIMLRTYTPDSSNPSLQAVPASGDFAIIPYQDAYVNVKWGSYTESKRATAGTITLMQKPEGVGSLNDTETYIYSASTLKSIGDLAPLYVGQCDISMATHLEELILGSGEEGYENANCTAVTIGNIPNMKKVDIRGLTSLVTPLNLAGCPNIEEIYAERTGVTAVTLPNGGYIKVLHLPESIKKLTVCNQEYIEDFVCDDLSGVTALRIENCPTLDLKEILAGCTNLQFARLTDVDWQEENSLTLEKLMQCNGIDENDNTTSGSAIVTGKCYIAEVDGDVLSQIRSKFPYLEVTYGSAGVTLYFKNAVNDDGVGGEELFRELLAYGSTGYYPYDAMHQDIEEPELPSTAQYAYTFTGWSGSITAVTSSKDITAQYSKTVRKYGVTWKANGQTIKTDANVSYGTTVEWTGSVPAYTGAESDMVFAGWTFINTDDDGNTTQVEDAMRYTVIGETEAVASFVKLTVPAQPTAFASCTWAQIIALQAAAYDGTLEAKTGYATLEDYGWAVGDEKTCTLKSGEEVVFKIWGFDISEDENNKALPATIGLKYSLRDSRKMNETARYLKGFTVTGSGTTLASAEKTNTYTYNNTNGQTEIVIDITARTYFNYIRVVDGSNTFTYYLNGARNLEDPTQRMDINYFAQEDCSGYTARAGKVVHNGVKDFSYTNTSGATGHIIVDGTNGEVRVYDRNLTYKDNNNVRSMEFMPGSQIRIPMSADGQVTIYCMAIWNGKGYYDSDLRKWLLNTFIDELPALIQERLVPVKRITQVGALNWDEFDTYYDKLIVPTYRELGYGSATGHPYCDENNKPFPTFSSNAMRQIATYRGGDQNAALRVWAASTTTTNYNNFITIGLEGTNSSYGAYNLFAVLFGFCIK